MVDFFLPLDAPFFLRALILLTKEFLTPNLFLFDVPFFVRFFVASFLRVVFAINFPKNAISMPF